MPLSSSFLESFHIWRVMMLVCCIVMTLPACSIKQYVLKRAGDAVSEGGSSFASDDDPQLVREAAPFSLKTIESLLEATPRHEGLLLAATRGFTQYAYGFVQQDADRLEDQDLKASQREALRARKLYARARQYGLRGLDVRHPRFEQMLRTERDTALASLKRNDVPLVYWMSPLMESDPGVLTGRGPSKCTLCLGLLGV
jgi:TRAP transporter T-component